jgi:hypothetical protein
VNVGGASGERTILLDVHLGKALVNRADHYPAVNAAEQGQAAISQRVPRIQAYVRGGCGLFFGRFLFLVGYQCGAGRIEIGGAASFHRCGQAVIECAIALSAR